MVAQLLLFKTHEFEAFHCLGYGRHFILGLFSLLFGIHFGSCFVCRPSRRSVSIYGIIHCAVLMYQWPQLLNQESRAAKLLRPIYVFPREWEKSEVYSFRINGIMGKRCDCEVNCIYPALIITVMGLLHLFTASLKVFSHQYCDWIEQQQIRSFQHGFLETDTASIVLRICDTWIYSSEVK